MVLHTFIAVPLTSTEFYLSHFQHRIIGLYISVVLVIGRFIRAWISELPSRLIFDEIVNPDPLLKLFSDIFLVRESKVLKLEEILVGKLFFIFRSPERLVKLTEIAKMKRE